MDINTIPFSEIAKHKVVMALVKAVDDAQWAMYCGEPTTQNIVDGILDKAEWKRIAKSLDRAFMLYEDSL